VTSDSFIFYRSFYESIKELEDYQRTEVLMAIMEYSLNGVKPKLTGVANAVFILIKPQIEETGK